MRRINPTEERGPCGNKVTTRYSGSQVRAEKLQHASRSGVNSDPLSLAEEPTMMNWPQFLDRADDWAVGFLTGAAATSAIVFAGAAVLLLVHGV